MIIIFMFSNQNGSESSGLSDMIVLFIQKFINIDKDLLSIIVRKGAHMSEYGLLTLSLIYGFYKNNVIHVYTYSLLITFLYASFDEFHQLFIAGRAGRPMDVLIDVCGGIIIILIVKGVNYVSNYRKKQ